ncbi:hypothetical protein DERF_007308 [Dermatophagoides farinae]|uniref:Uncharacterized protein n=1 Tax=Dermatophagoides farinae TaxID=6954 RepID=A0A922HYR6_DERFA|nr:hypothetical protein DERF_007308 [Dermatophagoides farinae]
MMIIINKIKTIIIRLKLPSSGKIYFELLITKIIKAQVCFAYEVNYFCGFFVYALLRFVIPNFKY